MPKNKILGYLVKCDRLGCGNEIFLEHLGTESLDGGYTEYEKFETLPDTWLEQHEIGYLCPRCAAEFRGWVTSFMGGNVVPKWDINVER